MCASEVNRLHKVLDDGGIKLGGVVSDINGVSARAMVSGLIEGKPVEQLLALAHGNMKCKRDDLLASLQGDLSARHLLHPVRMRQRRAHDQEHPVVQIPQSDGAQIA